MSKKSVVPFALLLLLTSLPLNAEGKSKNPGDGEKIAVKTGTVRPIWSRNIKVPYRAWVPEEKPHEVILCVHGLGFSSAAFSEFGRQMAQHGSAVYALDVRGFGAWMNRKGEDKCDFEACLTDIEAALKTIRKNFPGTPIFVAGESMGGAIALAAASRYPDLLDGLICSVPSSDRYAKATTEILVAANYLKDKDKPIDISEEVISRATSNPTLRKKWTAAPHNRMKISPKELKQFEDFMKGNNDAAALIQRTPVLMLAGFKDRLVKPEGTIELFNDLSVADKLLMVVGDGEHLLLEENQLTEQLEGLLRVWIRNQTLSRRPGVTAHP